MDAISEKNRCFTVNKCYKNNKMNKKNRCLLSVIILFTLFSFSQKKGGEIIYKIEPIKNFVNEKTISKSDIETKKALNFMNESLSLNVSKFSFRLKFNTTESTFELIDVLESDNNFDKGYKMAKILSQADNSYYTDKETNIRIISKKPSEINLIKQEELDSIKLALIEVYFFKNLFC